MGLSWSREEREARAAGAAGRKPRLRSAWLATRPASEHGDDPHTLPPMTAALVISEQLTRISLETVLNSVDTTPAGPANAYRGRDRASLKALLYHVTPP